MSHASDTGFRPSEKLREASDEASRSLNVHDVSEALKLWCLEKYGPAERVGVSIFDEDDDE